jgi:hypothetical protein
MSNFVCVDSAPSELEKHAFVVPRISFMDQILKCKSKQPKNGTISRNHLREVIAFIGMEYGDEEFDPLTSINISSLVGRTCSSDEEFDELLFNLFDKQYPKMFDCFVLHHLKQRPVGTKLVYFLPKNKGTKPLYDLGLQNIKASDIDVALGIKEKKVVGKPAVKDKKKQNTKQTNE